MDIPITYPIHNAILTTRAIDSLNPADRDLLWQACMGEQQKPKNWQTQRNILATMVLEFWRENGKESGMTIEKKIGLILISEKIRSWNPKKSKIEKIEI